MTCDGGVCSADIRGASFDVSSIGQTQAFVIVGPFLVRRGEIMSANWEP